jgi:hypothetical protein
VIPIYLPALLNKALQAGEFMRVLLMTKNRDVTNFPSFQTLGVLEWIKYG